MVIPLHNKRDFIGRTIASVLDQTLPPAEVIVVDDGSTDDGADIVRGLADPRIHLIGQGQRGAGFARNRGVAEAREPWVALIDADDLWRRDHLETLGELVRSFRHVDAVATGWREARDAMAIDLEAAPEPAPRGRMLDFFREQEAAPFHASSIAIRRTAFLRTSGFGPHAIGEDVEFWIRFALDHGIAISDRKTSIYIRGTGGSMERAQQDMAAGLPVPASPVLATLDAAIGSASHAARRSDIRAYADRTRLQYARALVYHGRGREARRMLAAVHGRSGARTGLYLLAHMPSSGLRAMARCWSLARRATRRRRERQGTH